MAAARAGAETQADDPAVRSAPRASPAGTPTAIIDSVHELGDLGLVQARTVEVRVHRAAPLFKLYILNGEEVFFGFYPVVEHTVTINGEADSDLRPDGQGRHPVPPRHQRRRRPPTRAQYVEQARTWFDSMWSTIAYEYTP